MNMPDTEMILDMARRGLLFLDVSQLWKRIKMPVVIPCYFLVSSLIWSYLLTGAIGLFNIWIFFLTMGAEPAFPTWDLERKGTNIWAGLFKLSCIGEFLIFILWILLQLLTGDNQRYPCPVLKVHISGLFHLCTALESWNNWLIIDRYGKLDRFSYFYPRWGGIPWYLIPCAFLGSSVVLSLPFTGVLSVGFLVAPSSWREDLAFWLFPLVVFARTTLYVCAAGCVTEVGFAICRLAVTPTNDRAMRVPEKGWVVGAYHGAAVSLIAMSLEWMIYKTIKQFMRA